MTVFILNDRLTETALSPGSTLLDFIRYEQGLTGTKIGCREGDCGACTVLEGVRVDYTRIIYRTIVSCLTPLGNAHGKHIVTVEGLNMETLSPVQQAFVDHNGTQCGFCTPGFVISLTGYALSPAVSHHPAAIASMDGNICRCTGYKSIERAAISLSKILADKDITDPLGWLVDSGFLPAYFLDIPRRLAALSEKAEVPVPEGKEMLLLPVLHEEPGHEQGTDHKEACAGFKPFVVGGGTDLMVQRPEQVTAGHPTLVLGMKALKGIRRERGNIVMGASTTASEIMNAPVMQELFPQLNDYFKLISSDPIRNMGTLAGNLVNASPIGDLSIFFLALDATLTISPSVDQVDVPSAHRAIPLIDFFWEYKKIDLKPGEVVVALSFRIPGRSSHFNFEKVSKRTHLDIASVNAAIYLETKQDCIACSHVSCGGVAPVPLYLKETSGFLVGKPLEVATIVEASDLLQQEIKPISDVRGSAAYKRLLARQLFFAHFLRLFPGRFDLEALTRKPLSV